MNEINVEVGKRLERVKGQPWQIYVKVGEQRIGTVLSFGDNPGREIRLNAAGKFWLHEMLTK